MVSKRSVWSILGLVAVLSLEANAGFFENFRYGMGYAGFQQQTVRNILGDGWDYSFAQDFNNKTYNFGNEQLNLLSGRLEGTASITHRGIPQVGLKLETPTPINYTFVAWNGIDKLHIDDGLFAIKSDIKFNAFGGYDIQLRISNRGTLVSDAPNAATVPIDYDIGPINIHGQWVVDLINLTLGEQFGFQIPGGAADQIRAALDGALTDPINEQVAAYAAHADPVQAPAGLSLTVVPEPASLLLLGLGVAGLAARRRRY